MTDPTPATFPALLRRTSTMGGVPSRSEVRATDGRLLWVDVAKGACILLVVLHHAVVKDLAIQAPLPLQPVAEAWAWVTMALKPVRMPLFFVLSGLVASSAVRRPWASGAVRRVAPSGAAAASARQPQIRRPVPCAAQPPRPTPGQCR